MKQARLKDLSRSGNQTGPAVTGSANVLINNRPASRVGDVGVHNNTNLKWEAREGAPCVLINGRRAHRFADDDSHVEASGTTVTGSANVLVGDYNARSREPKKTWIELVLIDVIGRPIPHAAYVLYFPNGEIMRGRLDTTGRVRLDSVPSGCYRVSYPEFDDREWK